MKRFTYTCHDKNGALKRGVIQAASRHDAVARLKAGGCVALSLEEAQHARRTSHKKYFLLLVPCMIVCSYFLFKAHTPTLKKEPQDVREPHAGRSAASGGKAGRSRQSPGNDVQGEEAESLPTADTNLEAGGVANAPEGRAVETAAPPAANPANQPVRPGMPYRSGTEQVIGIIMNTRLGKKPPPLFNLPRSEDISRILDRDITVYDDDDEAVIEAKANTAHAKQLLKQYLKDGGTPENFLRYYHGLLQEAHEEWNTAQRHVLDLLLEGRQEEAEQYAESQTKVLAEKNIQPVVIPPRFRQQN